MKISEIKKYYERGVFLDQDPFVTIRLWRGGVMVKNFGMLKPKAVQRHDGSIEMLYADHPRDAKEAAERWASITDVVEVNP